MNSPSGVLVREQPTASVLIDHSVDNTCRSSHGERLHHILELRCDALKADGRQDHPAVDGRDGTVTYRELDEGANQLARHLSLYGVEPGSRVGLLLPRSSMSYAAMLAVSKLHAAFVPLDAAFPADRISYIAADSGFTLIVSVAEYAPLVDSAGVRTMFVDLESQEIASHPGHRIESPPPTVADDDVSYVIYTSGTTGRPKGVAIEHRSITNFVRVAAENYGVQADDRMYQGMTIAFDFSVEEIWVALAVGATLVPNTTGQALLGEDLRAFLVERGVTALCCVPTLLATVGDDLEQLRFLLVSGEACPQDLVERWYRPDRVFLNVYGPTEATVSATWTRLYPGKGVTIGVPLPTYSAVIVDPEGPRLVADGAEGELALAGVGLARGYVGRDDLTQAAFIPDFVGMPENPSGRLYRTGDLARIDDHGEIVYLGRIDTQVKIRGYRIELTEIESVLMNFPGVAQAIVDTHEPAPGVVELAAWYTLLPGAGELDVDAILAMARDRLPPYMVPSYLDQVDIFALSPGGKVDRAKLPAPIRRGRASDAVVGPDGQTEHACAAALSELLGIDVSVTDHFFDDLGTSSLLMAQYAALVRDRTGHADLGMRDLYQNPTVRSLAVALDQRSEPGTVADQRSYVRPGRSRRSHRASRAEFVGTGVAQFVVATLLGWLLIHSIAWTSQLVLAASSLPAMYLRGVLGGLTIFVTYVLIAVYVKWWLVGRWSVSEYPIWSRGYVRIWLVQQLVSRSPMILFAGSPLFNVYLRMLGVKVGSGAIVETTRLPVCTDLVSIGEGAVIRRGASIRAIKAESGILRTGRIDIGAGAYIGVGSHLDINTAVGDGAQLGHASALHEGQSIPAHTHVHGSPAEPTEAVFDRIDVTDKPSRLRKIGFTVFQVVTTFFVAVPLAIVVAMTLIQWRAYRLAVAGPLFAGAIVLLLVVTYAAPRVLGRFVAADKTYGLYGGRYILAGVVRSLSNSRFLHLLFGDSSYITGHVHRVGLELTNMRQTGSNFGVAHRWDSPTHIDIGPGTMISDVFDMANMDLGSGGFRINNMTVSGQSFFGNQIVYPAGAQLMGDVLIGTKAMIPIDGQARSGVGLLGSPPFEIPRETFFDESLTHPSDGPVFDRALRGKNWSNLATMAMFVVYRFVSLYLVVAATVWTIGLLDGQLEAALVLAGWIGLVGNVLLLAAAERFFVTVDRWRTVSCSIYDSRFWRHERYWKLADTRLLAVFAGTPLSGAIWRLMGVQVGAQLYDAGIAIPERGLVTIGDHCTLNEGSVVQGHSLEEGIFKSDAIELGDDVTLEPGAFVHYGTTVGNRSSVGADAFLMKGEMVEADTSWSGNPARPDRRGPSEKTLPGPPSH